MNGWIDSIKNALDENAFEQAKIEQESGKDPADFLLKGKHLTTPALLGSLSSFYRLPSLLLNQYEPDEKAIARVPEEVARRFSVMPLFILKDKLYVATSNPADLMAIDFIRIQTGLSVEEFVTTAGNIEQAINRHYLVSERTKETVKTIVAQKKEELEVEDEFFSVSFDDHDAPSIKLVDHIISTAIRLGASDIHIEPFQESSLLRFRLDGVLREYAPPPLDMIKSVISRIKILANLDVAERRLPQDGRSAYALDEKEYDLRVSVIPNLYGESIVIRILAASAEVKELKNLGFEDAMLEEYERMIIKPHGVLLVTGPTGSGKSTTLYATLRHIFTTEKKIITLEDPIESKITGITQFQMNSAIGFTFARALRSVLRHDPEIILVGEIRDQETAEIAIRASLTGHLLFSTLHTNDAPSAPTRLIDMGVAGYLVMNSLIGVLAQRLIRRLCPYCKKPIQPEESHHSALEITSIPSDATLHGPEGCGNCQKLGYKGRVAIYELLPITPEMKRLPEKEMTAERLRQIAERQGFVSLRQSGVKKWFQGMTSLEEVVKLTVE